MADSELILRAKIATLEADEILHRGGPASFIELVMKLAAESAERSRYSDAQDKAEEAEIEFNASKSAASKQALLEGYQRLKDICEEKMHMYKSWGCRDWAEREDARYAKAFAMRVSELSRPRKLRKGKSDETNMQ